MPTAESLDMLPTLAWYEDNIDEIEEKIHQCFLYNRHRLPVRIEQLLKDHIDGIVIPAGMSLEEDLGLYPDDLFSAFSCFNPGFWERSTFARLYVEKPLWFTQSMADKVEGALPTSNPAEALSLTHCVPAFTAYLDDEQPDETVGYGSFIHLYKLGCDVSPDVRRVVAIECIFHELTHSLITPIVHGSRKKGPLQLRLPDGTICSEFDLIDSFDGLYDQFLTGISHYANGYLPDHNVPGMCEEVCESVPAHLLGFAFREDGDLCNFRPFADRTPAEKIISDIIGAYVAKTPS